MIDLVEEERRLWLLDRSRDSFRVMLMEIEHSSGTVFIASRPWMSESHIAYDDFLLTDPFLESELDSFNGIGDFECINLDENDDWNNHLWSGYECRWYYGDMTWYRSEFIQLGRAIIDDCQPKGQRVFQFNLHDNGFRLKQKITGTLNNVSVQEAIDWIVDKTGVSITFNNVGPMINNTVSLLLDNPTDADQVVKDLAKSCGAYMRTDQFGNVELITPSSIDLNLDIDVIGSDRVKVVDIIPAYSNVVVEMEDGTEVSGVTNARTGQLNETVSYKTRLTNTAQAQALLNFYIIYHSDPHYSWEIPVTDLASVINTGEIISLTHPDIAAAGVVTRLRRSPLSTFTDIEVTT